MSNEYFFRIAHPIWWILCCGGMYLTYYIAYTEEIAAPLTRVHQFAMLLFKSRANIQFVFIAAVLAHLVESIICIYVAIEKGCSFSRQLLWFFQTVCLGYPSLSILLSRPDFPVHKGYMS